MKFHLAAFSTLPAPSRRRLEVDASADQALGPDNGLCNSLMPAALIVGDSVSSQFFRALVSHLGGRIVRPARWQQSAPYPWQQREWERPQQQQQQQQSLQNSRMTAREAQQRGQARAFQVECDGSDEGAQPTSKEGQICAAIRALPSHAARAKVCGGKVVIAYIRNDWCDSSLSYPIADQGIWHCAQHYSQLSPDQQVALRQTTHLCGTPDPVRLTCDGVPCVGPLALPTSSRACESTCKLASEAFRCGESSVDPCRGCRDALSFVSKLCDGASVNRSNFCASTSPDAPRPDEAAAFHTAHCAPWASTSLLRQFRVLIFNAGAHRVPMETYSRLMRELGGVIRQHRRARRGSLSGSSPAPAAVGHSGYGPSDSVAVFRVTVPGFSGCNATRTAPRLQSVAQAEAYYAAHSFFQQHLFVPMANRIAAVEVAKAGGLILDVYPQSITRLDDRSGATTSRGGMDCLHYRAPLLNTSLAAWITMLGSLLHRHQHWQPSHT